MTKQAYASAAAPQPRFGYSQAVRKGNILAVAGQIAVDPATGSPVGDGIAEQTRQAMTNLVSALDAAGASMEDVIMVRVYLTEREHFEAMDKAYQEFVPAPYPARTTVFVGLVPGMLVEFDALAVVDA